MKTLFFDCFSGISGDMTIGALLDLGIDRKVFLERLSGLNIDGYRIVINEKVVNGIRGTDVDVILNDHDHEHEHDDHNNNDHVHAHENDRMRECMCEHKHAHEHTHERECGLKHDFEHEHDDHDHEHEHHGHNHEHHDYNHEHDHDHGHEHDHHNHDHNHDHGHTHRHGERGIREIFEILDNSNISKDCIDISKRIFHEIAAAEARVHGKPIEQVHFHEVGAIDSIVDIAGTAICLELLGVERIASSELHDGSGFITCQHGVIPVPVPAVAEMLSGSGIPVITEDVDTELVTPTGMGIIKCIAQSFGKRPSMTVDKVGYGFGKRNIGRLNALRVMLGEAYDEKLDDKPEDGGEIAVLETNIDDTTGEILGYTMSKLMDAGALDVFYTPIFMKKNRSAYMLTALGTRAEQKILEDIILTQTSTIGIRISYMKRRCMHRRIVTVKLRLGEVRVKIAEADNIRKAAPEYEDCRIIAEREGIALSKVYEMARAAVSEQYGI